jgi:predicted dehydrogenase
VITLPSALHAVAATRAFELNTPVYLEKPIAIDEAECLNLVNAWRKSGTIAAVGFNYRFNKIFLELKNQIESGTVGPISFVRTEFSCTADSQHAWRKQRRTGGGALLELASHHFDLLRFLFQTEIDEVACRTESIRSESDTAFVQLRLTNGISVQSIFSMNSAERDAIEVHGANGTLVAETGAFALRRYSKFKRSSRRDGVNNFFRELAELPFGLGKLKAARNEPSYRLCLDQFLRSVASGSPIAPNLLDGFRSLQVVLAAERSAERGTIEKIINEPQLALSIAKESATCFSR